MPSDFCQMAVFIVMKNIVKEKFSYGMFYCADVRDLLLAGEIKGYNVILTDPPYGVGIDYWDDESEFFDIEGLLYENATVNCWLVFFWTIKKLNVVFKKLDKFVYRWLLPVVHFSSRTKSIIGSRRYFPVLVYSKGNPKTVRKTADVLFSFEIPQVVGKINNPVFKSTGTLLHLLSLFVNIDDKRTLVFDPFAGLGGVAFCCELCGIPWVAVERDEKTFARSIEFIKNRRIEMSRLKPLAEQYMLF